METTLAQENTRYIKSLLHMRRTIGLKPFYIGQLNAALRERAMYRSDEPMQVFVVNDAFGAGDVIFTREGLDWYQSEHESEDTPTTYREDTMTGREFGNLPMCEDMYC